MWGSLQSRRQLFRQTLSFATLKLLYARLTLTRFTTLYFFFAIFACTVLSAQQGLTFSENSAAVSIVSSFVNESGYDGLILLEKGVLEVCDGLPNQPGTNCSKIMTFGQNNLTSRSLWDGVSVWPRKPYVGDTDQAEANIDPYFDISLNETLSPGGPCLLSLQWLDGIFHDAQREDVVTLLFQIWLFLLATITKLLNESIPHLGAALFGHVFGTAWSCYRVLSTQSLRVVYQNQIVPEACDNQDLLGDWWGIRIQHAITIVIVNILTLICLSYLSFRLFQVYANESFSRVGASPKVHRIYKLVLFFSVCLHLTGFFSVASTALWLNKVCYGSMRNFTTHSDLYMATFIVMLVFQFPWLFLGWSCVRRESKIYFGVFSVLSVFLVTLCTFLFSKPMYRYIFMSWPFFATLTVTAYVFSIVSTILGVLCRLNFGKGLAHYLQVMEALAGVDFTAVHFPKGYDVEEKVGIFASELKTPPPSNDKKFDPHQTFAIQLPALAYSQSQNLNAKASENNAGAHAQAKTKQRGSSIYSEPNGMPILLSSSPPLVSEFGPAPARLSRLSYSKSGSQKRATAYGRPTSRGGGGGDKTQRELDRAVRILTPEMPAPPILESKQTVMPPQSPPMLGPPGIERPEAAATAPSSPIVFKQPPPLSGYAPASPPSPSSSLTSNSNSSSLSPPPRLPSPPLPSPQSVRSEGSVPSSRLERSQSASSKWSIESSVEMNLKRKKLQKLGMGAGLPPTSRPNNQK